ncbi:vesicular-fusion protein S17 [Orbilia oligospora]|uniref:Vesicular-fusion protein S17 n=1 Tax=Orbilia oligospora TaxID=2813651 RepID=A0A7C8K2M7_ORBOL|nr:vesicular-fusion protein S17 [Orbilia oligospora]KAF3113140.1 vesicular-fusion protein S17 [Orbilia oligospora]KAF3117479.1 vesicular-fusion protein S17 [Orbilia oligospora]KAF3133858.1 vesicular-fusion protein S17 [Orbilia oligospora]KAF3146934.1 vesicular-fusion protein S17 [Orbilia oligospora]
MDGRSLLAQAQKQEAASAGGFSWFGASKQDKLEQAIELYAQAANAFRTSGQGSEAGAAFEKAAALSKSINEPNDAANYLTEAFKSYKKTNPADAARTLSQAIEHYALTNVRRAATQKQTLAEHLETDPATKPQAIKEYEKAGEWFSNDNAEALANKCYIRAADISAETGDYHRAINHYERIAEVSVNNNLMKWSVKEYLFKAALCHLATKDIVATKRALEGQYPALDPAFSPPSMECLFLKNLLESVENGEPQGFFNNVMQYKERYPLDNWKLDILAKTQKSIEEAADDLT